MQMQKGSDSESQPEQKKQISEKGKCVKDTVDAMIIETHKLVMDSGIHAKSLQNSCNAANYSSSSSGSLEKEPLDNVNEEPMKTIFNANGENFVTVSKDGSLSAGDVQAVFETSGISADGNLDAILYESSTHGNGITNGFENEVGSQLANLQNSGSSLDSVTKQNSGTDSLEPERNVINLRKKKLLVLDVNGLLADIFLDIRHVHKGRMKVGGKVVFKRPFCDDFMKFCFEKFDVGIWSSRKKYNVDNVIDYILGESRQKLLFSWDQDHCTDTGFKTLENVHKPLVLKELKRLWDKGEMDLPWEKGDYSPSNTLLVDDSPYKALCNPAFTAIFPVPYQSDNVNDASLGPGGDLRVYLEGLYEANDVQTYVKQHPFGQQGITSNDPSWNFYSQVIQKVHYHQSGLNGSKYSRFMKFS